MTTTPHIANYTIGSPGAAASVQGEPAMFDAQQPDTVIDAGVVGGLTIRAASVRGAGHRYEGTTRQDDFSMGTAGPHEQWLVVVVADGVSAGPRSHLAARVAVRIGVQLLQAALAKAPADRLDWNELVGALAGHVLIQARRDQDDESLDARAAARVMASTVVFAIVPIAPDGSGARSCAVTAVGDTSAWILRAGARWEPATEVKNAGNAVASSATLALPLLPSEPITPHHVVVQSGEALFVVTDGVGDPLGDGSGGVGQALAEAWSLPPNRYAFAAQVDFGRRSHTDDRTAVGIWADVPADDEPLPPPAAKTVDLAANRVASTPVAPNPAASTSPAPAGGGLPEADPFPSSLPATWEPTTWEPTPWEPSGATTSE